MYKRLKRIRSGFGIGDNIYCQSIARALIGKEKLEICTAYPEIYIPLKDHVQFAEFSRANIDYLSHYTTRKSRPTTQWEDIQITAGVEAELRLDWTPQRQPLIDKLPDEFVFVSLPRTPMNRKDGFGRQLSPDYRVMDWILGKIPYPKVLVGKGEPLYGLENIDIDYTNQTSLTDVIDIAWKSKGIIGQVSYIVPLAESLSKPLMVVWSHAGLKLEDEFLRQIKPEKILHKYNNYVIDSWDDERIGSETRIFVSRLRSGQREI